MLGLIDKGRTYTRTNICALIENALVKYQFSKTYFAKIHTVTVKTVWPFILKPTILVRYHLKGRKLNYDFNLYMIETFLMNNLQSVMFYCHQHLKTILLFSLSFSLFVYSKQKCQLCLITEERLPIFRVKNFDILELVFRENPNLHYREVNIDIKKSISKSVPHVAQKMSYFTLQTRLSLQPCVKRNLISQMKWFFILSCCGSYFMTVFSITYTNVDG